MATKPHLGKGLSRRDILAGAAATAIGAAIPMSAAAKTKPNVESVEAKSADLSIRRYMAVAVTLLDGRILLTGGYNRPQPANSRVMPTSSALIVDPETGEVTPTGSMITPRARHAAVTLPDGRVAVLGGFNFGPTASVELYDPQTGEWSSAEPMSTARYDHTATVRGAQICVLGGSNQSICASLEMINPGLPGRSLLP